MSNDTIEGAELALEIGPKILKEFDNKKLSLMMSLIENICNKKKFIFEWS